VLLEVAERSVKHRIFRSASGIVKNARFCNVPVAHRSHFCEIKSPTFFRLSSVVFCDILAGTEGNEYRRQKMIRKEG
jgi:hypothetical protein